ncbi:DsbA family protein [Chryseobacterium jejuense]|uniref:Thioredoxin-like fold domain-containing protein n=1 Tax=Chryseobacterium jejuense TaxID=445960 RepID=A0A2X2WXR7_CHRJE|nr:thioredoxin domain-containing protein [Chryseobacterium jejuense]SQB45606.1 Uncharacterised protein [Chryseobacterium jejuense]
MGKKDARIRISVISNPYCGFCKDGHKLAESLLKKYPEDVSLQMRFNYTSERSNEKYDALISDLAYIYNNKPENEFLHAVEEWFETRDESKINMLSGGVPTSENLDSLNQMTVENSNAGLNFTPILVINGYQFPEKYDREDIVFFVDELIEDDEI